MPSKSAAQRVEKLVFDTLADYQESLKGKQLRPAGVLVYGKIAVAQEVKTLAQLGFMVFSVVVIAFALCSFKKIASKTFLVLTIWGFIDSLKIRQTVVCLIFVI